MCCVDSGCNVNMSTTGLNCCSCSLPTCGTCWHVWNWQWPNSWKICHLLTWLSEWMCLWASYKPQCDALHLKQCACSFSVSPLFFSQTETQRHVRVASDLVKLFFFFLYKQLQVNTWKLSGTEVIFKTRDLIILTHQEKITEFLWWDCGKNNIRNALWYMNFMDSIHCAVS